MNGMENHWEILSKDRKSSKNRRQIAMWIEITIEKANVFQTRFPTGLKNSG